MMPSSLSPSRLRVGEALLQKLSTTCTAPSRCRSNPSFHHTCWTEEGGDIEVPHVCISRRHRHLRCYIGSDREEEKRVRLHHPRPDERSAVRIFKGMKISSNLSRCLHLLD